MPTQHPLMAITLHRPWAYAVAHLGKDIENRTWACPLPRGRLIAIHAGKKYDQQAATWIQQTLGHDCPPEAGQPTGIVALAEFGGTLTEADSPWFVGPIGWRLSRIVPIEPVHCKGQQGLWKVEGDTLAAVRRAYALATA